MDMPAVSKRAINILEDCIIFYLSAEEEMKAKFLRLRMVLHGSGEPCGNLRVVQKRGYYLFVAQKTDSAIG
jgi:hypothetical protein